MVLERVLERVLEMVLERVQQQFATSTTDITITSCQT